MRIAVVGSGYVGLVAGVCFADFGHEVILVDNDDRKLAALENGEIPIHEKFLPELLGRHRGRRLQFSDDLREAVHASSVIFVAVGTPPTDRGEADLSFVESVAREISGAIADYKVIVEKSTVPVYTSEWVRKIILRNGADPEAFDVASNPEFLREGTAVTDFLFPDRIVIGCDNQHCADVLRQIYAPLVSGSYHQRNDAIPRPDRAPIPAPLIVTTTKNLPLAGGVQHPFTVGADTWLLVASSPKPLVGTLGWDSAWISLVRGLLVAVLVTTVVETQSRRRDYAAALVEERTTSLRQAVTDLEQAQAQMVRQEKLAAMGQLASTVGHELRNPLAVIVNVLYLLETTAGAGASEAMHRHLATARRETSAAALIVSDLLDYAAGRAPMSAPVQLAELVAEALSVVPPPAGVAVVQDIEPGTVINADRDQIRQVLLNLITNGYDAMPDGGMLDVSARSSGNWAQIAVTDTGTGMDEETKARIFTPFYTSKSRGIGLGLAVAKRVVDAHGGTISVQSTPSAGAAFTVTVPIADTTASVPQ